MLARFIFWAAIAGVVIAVLAVPLRLAANRPSTTQTMSGMSNGLLIFAGVLSAFMTLIILAAAAWGMDTSVPWGLGIYPYLIPALQFFYDSFCADFNPGSVGVDLQK